MCAKPSYFTHGVSGTVPWKPHIFEWISFSLDIQVTIMYTIILTASSSKNNNSSRLQCTTNKCCNFYHVSFLDFFDESVLATKEVIEVKMVLIIENNLSAKLPFISHCSINQLVNSLCVVVC